MAESGKSGVRKSPESSKERVTMDNAHRLPEGSMDAGLQWTGRVFWN